MCKHDDGCNAPEGECSGACMTQQTSGETLEDIAERIALEVSNEHGWSGANPDLPIKQWNVLFVQALITDPAILDHIPAVKALREENERLNNWRNWWCPDVCPITGLPFFMWITHHETDQWVPTYGGPYDSYTIPVRDEDGCYIRECYDHDLGGWRVDEHEDVGVQIVNDQLYTSEEYPEKLKAQIKSLTELSDARLAWGQRLESQLAELRQGGEAVAYAVTERSSIQLIRDYDEFHLEFFRTSADAQQYINDEVLGLLEAGMGGEDVDLVALPLYTRPQPAIPPGYAVPDLSKLDRYDYDVVTHGEVQLRGVFQKRDGAFVKLEDVAELLATTPSVPVAEKVPSILFDGYSVYSGLSDQAKKRTSADNVSDTLDSVVKLLRAAPADSKEGEK